MVHSGCFDVILGASGGCFSGAAKLGVLELVQSNLSALVRTCLLYGGRSTAHKVARLLALCLEYVVCRASHITVGYTLNNTLVYRANILLVLVNY